MNINIGIYRLVDQSDREYIGSSVNLKLRKYTHFWLLKKNRHFNIKLQNSWNKYGEDFFRFEAFYVCAKEELLKIEQAILDNVKPHYNIALTTNVIMTGRKFSEEHKRKIREANSGSNHYNWGKQRSKETKDKIRATILGRKHSLETRMKMSVS